jgi:hypothetical protein
MKPNSEYQTFSSAMNTILRADPDKVKAAMEAEKNERAMEAGRTGKRGRGRPSKNASSAHAVSEKG